MPRMDRTGAPVDRKGVARSLALTLVTLTLVTAAALRAEDEPDTDADTAASSSFSSTAGDCPFGAATPRGGRLIIQRAPDELLREGRVAPAAFLARSHGQVGLSSPSAPARTHRGLIDVEIFGKMATDGIAPAERSTDAEFLRRAMLDLTGQIPSVAALTAFTLDERPDKRDLAVENLLRSDAFDDRWAMWLGDLVENVKTTVANGVEQPLGRDAFFTYLRTSLAHAKPYDQLVREILAGNGDSFASGPPNFWIRNIATMGVTQDTWDNEAAAAGEKFLGMQVNCTGCHNGAGHTDAVNVYLSTKTRMDFWKNAAFFAQTAVSTAVDPASTQRKYLLADVTTGSYLLNTKSGNRPARAPVTGQSNKVDPAFYLTGEKPQPGKPLRAEFARMLTAHPQFARATVNYIWKEMFGVGIVEPVDGFDLYRLDPAALPPGQTVQASHPALLAQLATQFASGGYDVRALLRAMANSEAYQLSSRYTPAAWSETYTRYFARRITRRMTSEQLLDAVFSASGVWPTGTSSDALSVQGWATPPTRAIQLPDPLEARGSRYNAFLNTFLRGNRDTNPRSSDTSALQALALMNDANTILPRLLQSNAGSLVARTLKATTKPEDIVDALWLGTLSRPPTAAEKATAVTYLKSGKLGPKTENLQWALFNKLEFAFY
ncbi:MAG TPA: DUF1553 domain-containing protein [Thermoanaerobaculia bacterium]